MSEKDYFSEIPSSVLFDILAGYCDNNCDFSDRREAESILIERGYSDDQIDKKVTLHKKWWHLKSHDIVAFFRWALIASAIPLFYFNYAYRELATEVYFEAIVLALLFCGFFCDKQYRGSRQFIYQGVPLPMNLFGICEKETDFPYLMLLTGPLNILIFTNLIVFFYVLASRI